VIGAELHLAVKTVLWQETTAWQEGSDSVAGNGDVTVPLLQCPELYLPNRVLCQRLPRLTSGSEPGLLNGIKLCPLSSSQDSTAPCKELLTAEHQMHYKLNLWCAPGLLFVLSIFRNYTPHWEFR